MSAMETIPGALGAGILFAASILGLLAFVRSRSSLGVAVAAVPLLLAGAWAIIVEILSATFGTSSGSLRAAACVMAVMGVGLGGAGRSGFRRLREDGQAALSAASRAGAQGSWWRWPLAASVVLAALAVCASFVVALVGAPNNGDSLGYHLPRVMWWLQQGHVGPYVSPDISQSTYPPLPEYLLLVVRGTAGSDLLLNLVQWTIGCFVIAAMALTGWEITRTGVMAVLTASLVATIPTGITQLTTTQSDWVAAVWPLLALALVVARSRGRISVIPYALLLALAGALTMASKPTAALATGLVIVLAMWWELRPPPSSMVGPRPDRWGAALVLAAGFAAGSLIGGMPQVLRNLESTGSVLGVKTDIFVAHPSLAITWANSIRTLVNNIGVPPPLSNLLNERLPEILGWIGVPWEDPDAIHLSNVVHIGLGRNEDLTTNPVHLILGLVVAIIVAVWPTTPRMLRHIAILSVTFYVLSNGLLQWQEWSTRFFLTAMAMFSLPLAWLGAQWLTSTRQRVNVRSLVASALLLATTAYGLAVAVAQEYRPLVGPGSVLTTPRIDQYFRVVNRPGAPDTPREVLEA